MSTAIEICDGRRFLGRERERQNGTLGAVVAEQVIGPDDTRSDATDALLDVVRAGGGT